MPPNKALFNADKSAFPGKSSIKQRAKAIVVKLEPMHKHHAKRSTLLGLGTPSTQSALHKFPLRARSQPAELGLRRGWILVCAALLRGVR
jgi:hypothetical protein